MKERKKEKLVNQSFSLRESELEMFRQKCADNDITMTAVIRILVRSYCGINRFNDSWLASVPEGIKKFLEERESK